MPNTQLDDVDRSLDAIVAKSQQPPQQPQPRELDDVDRSLDAIVAKSRTAAPPVSAAAVDTTQPDSTWQRIRSFMSHPLLSSNLYLPGVSDIEDASEFVSKELQQSGHGSLAKIASAPAGVAQGIKDTVSGMTTPTNLGIVGLTGGLGAMEDAAVTGLAKLGLSPAISQAIPRLINMGFALTGLYTAAKSSPAIVAAIKRDDVEEASRLLTGAAGTVGLASVAGINALGDLAPRSLSEPRVQIVPTEAQKLELENAKPATAKTVSAEPSAAEPKPETTIAADTKTESPEAKTTEGKEVPISRVVNDSTLPVVSQDALLAEATQRQINNSAVIRQMVDPTTLKSPEDIQNAITAISEHLGNNLDLRVAQRIGFSQQVALANELQMPVEDLIRRRSGTAFNAETVTASRALLKSYADSITELAAKAAGGDTAAADQQALQIATYQELANQIAGVASESGRALGSFRIDYDALPEVKIARAMAQLQPGTLDDANALLAKIDKSDPLYVQKVNSFVKQITPSTTSDKVFEIYRSGLLSGPATLVKKSVSEAMLGALEATSRVVTGGLANLRYRAGITDQPEAFASEGYYFSRGAAMAFTHLRDVLSNEFDFADAPELAHAPGFEGGQEQAVKGVLGRIIRLPGTVLSRTANMVYLANYMGEINSLAARQALSEGLSGEELAARQDWLSHNPTKEMSEAAHRVGLHGTFQDDLSGWMAKVQPALQYKYLRFLFPFVKTLSNLISASADYSPIGLIRGTATADLTQQSKGLLGTAIMAAAMYLANEGLVSGGGATDFKKRESETAAGNFESYSLKLGNKFIAYHMAEPLGLLIGGSADLIHSLKHDEDPAISTSKAQSILAHLNRNIDSFPFLLQISSLIDSLTNLGNGNRAEKNVDNILSAVVPAFVKDTAQTIDPVIRTPAYQGLTNPIPGLVGTIESRIPGLTKNVPPDISLRGQPVKRSASELGGANAFPIVTSKPDPISQELYRLGLVTEAAPKSATVKGIRGKRVALPGSKMSSDEARTIQQQEESEFYQRASLAINTPSWPEIPDKEKVIVLHKLRVISQATRYPRLLKLRQGQ